MKKQRSIRTSLAGALALALFGITSIATAQPQPQASQQLPPPPPPPPPQQPAMPPPPPAPPQATRPTSPQPPSQNQRQDTSGQFEQGTKSTATYPMQNGTLTVNAGMPAESPDYGPPPPFKSLDTNGDGRINETEAKAYLLLRNDFLHASHNGQTISRAAYAEWVRNLGTQ